ncbi:MAG: hypothetical protein GF401_20305 [Chitinivibrionales bacterium]|nr:hypothetical protein [Chitinivibrionales bacterium]
MKTVDISLREYSVHELLKLARREVVQIKTKNGETFIISTPADLDTEVQLLRKNNSYSYLIQGMNDEQIESLFGEEESAGFLQL